MDVIFFFKSIFSVIKEGHVPTLEVEIDHKQVFWKQLSSLAFFLP